MELGRLQEWLQEAWKDYHATWAVVDDELYDLCRRKGHDRFEDVYAKVAIINRVYMAGLSRSVVGTDDADAGLRVTRLLLKHGHELSEGLRQLQGINELTAVSMATIVEVHGSVTRRLAGDLDATNLCSFVSKYLHFHCPTVPIYDSRVAEHIVDALGAVVSRGTRTDRLLDRPAVFDPSYYWYAGRFLKLWELVQESTPEATVKILDHALWRGAPKV